MDMGHKYINDAHVDEHKDKQKTVFVTPTLKRSGVHTQRRGQFAVGLIRA
jgi:hypothetical protein